MTKIVKFNSVDIAQPEQLINFAQTLKQIIVEQNLFTDIQGKKYVNVEGWQILGVATGILPIVISVVKLDRQDEIAYQATVELRKGDTVVGASMAVCSNKELKRRNADEYVIASMAQTRAIGKAYRNCLSWVIKMAGYEATPAEEADVRKPDTEELANEKEYKRVLTHIIDSQTIEQLQEVEGLIKKHGLENQYKEKMELLNA